MSGITDGSMFNKSVAYFAPSTNPGGDVIINDNLEVKGNLLIDGVSTLGVTNVTGATSVTGPLTVTGATNITGATTVTGNLITTGPTALSTAGGLVTTGGGITATGAIATSASVTAGADITATGTVYTRNIVSNGNSTLANLSIQNLEYYQVQGSLNAYQPVPKDPDGSPPAVTTLGQSGFMSLAAIGVGNIVGGYTVRPPSPFWIKSDYTSFIKMINVMLDQPNGYVIDNYTAGTGPSDPGSMRIDVKPEYPANPTTFYYEWVNLAHP